MGAGTLVSLMTIKCLDFADYYVIFVKYLFKDNSFKTYEKETNHFNT